MLTDFYRAWKWLIGVASLAFTLHYEVKLPTGWQFNEKAPSSITAVINDGVELKQAIKNETGDLVFEINNTQSYKISAEAKVYLCEARPMGRCTMKRVSNEGIFTATNDKLSPNLVFEIPRPQNE